MDKPLAAARRRTVSSPIHGRFDVHVNIEPPGTHSCTMTDPRIAAIETQAAEAAVTHCAELEHEAQGRLVATERERIDRIRDLWVRGFREASWGHGRGCNIHTRATPGTGCTCVFGQLNAAILKVVE